MLDLLFIICMSSTFFVKGLSVILLLTMPNTGELNASVSDDKNTFPLTSPYVSERKLEAHGPQNITEFRNNLLRRKGDGHICIYLFEMKRPLKGSSRHSLP